MGGGYEHLCTVNGIYWTDADMIHDPPCCICGPKEDGQHCCIHADPDVSIAEFPVMAWPPYTWKPVMY